jgi:hypothetical protein
MRWTCSMSAFAQRVLAGVVLALTAGCDIPAQIVWCPDGSRAAYRSDNAAFLLDQKGVVLRTLGNSTGGFAWSADSKSLYFAAAVDDLHTPPTPINLQWLGPADHSATQASVSTSQVGVAATQTAASATASSAQPKSMTVVSVLFDGNAKPLFRVADTILWYLTLSPDGQWLAAMTGVDGDSTGEMRLLVYSLKRGMLYEVSRYCGLGACFTGPRKLAFVEANDISDVGRLTGHVVEVKLDDGSRTLPRQLLLNVWMAATAWMEPSDGGLIFTAAPNAFPSPVMPRSSDADPEASDTPAYKLFHFSDADCGLSVLADDVGGLFDASPNGKRILYVKLTAPEPAATAPTTASISSQPARTRADLCVMNANGSDPHVLSSLDAYLGQPQPPMWPAWHGNAQITFIAPADQARNIHADNADRKAVNVVEYRLTEKGTLEQLRLLSADWKAEMKPYFQHGNAK